MKQITIFRVVIISAMALSRRDKGTKDAPIWTHKKCNNRDAFGSTKLVDDVIAFEFLDQQPVGVYACGHPAIPEPPSLHRKFSGKRRIRLEKFCLGPKTILSL
jgi:hypothetical protein